MSMKKNRYGDLINLRNSLVPPKKCLGCQMELLPYLGEDDIIIRPNSGYCSPECKEMFHKYYQFFYKARMPRKIVVPKDKSLPTIDLRL